MPGANSSKAFTDYDSLVGTIARWLAREDLKADIPDFIWLCECELQREVHFRLRDAVVTGTSVADQKYIDLPEDFVEARFFEWDELNSIPVEVRSWADVSNLQKKQTLTGALVRGGVVHGSRLYLGPAPGAANYTFFYKSGVSHLSSSNQSNTILDEYPDALLYGSLKHSAPFIGSDERVMLWKGIYDEAKASAIQQEARSRTGHGPLSMRPDVAVR